MTFTPRIRTIGRVASSELCCPRAKPLIATLAAIGVCLGFLTDPVVAQQATVPHLKAAFLFNFAKFTEWPADTLATGQRLTLCVMGDESVADALERTISGRRVDAHELVVLIVTIDDPIRSCHLLYATGLDTGRSTQLLRSLIGAAVFTVSDTDQFAEGGGIAQLIVEGDRMRFAVNVTSTHRAGLTLSSKLLALAKIVKDGPNVPQ